MTVTLEGILELGVDVTGETAVTFANTLKIAQSENQGWNKISNENPGRGCAGRINLEFPEAATGATAMTLTVKDRAVEGEGAYANVVTYNVSDFLTEDGSWSVDLPDVLRAEVAFDLAITGTTTAGTVNAYIGERAPDFNVY